MNTKPSIELDRRDAQQLIEQILARRPGYTPEWQAEEKSAGTGLVGIVARYLEAAIQRLNQTPAKNKLAFLDLAGLSLIAAQAARAPVVFQLGEKATGGSVPARTAIAAAPPPGGKEQVLFETETAAGITAGKIQQLFSLWPGRDEYIDHSAAFLAGEQTQLFAASLRMPAPHHLYLSHSVLLALAGNVELAVEFELKQLATSPLEVLWEYWDGEVWRGFLSTSRQCQEEAEDADSTAGLTQSGRYVLRGDCAEASKTKVNGVEGYWLRGRLTQPLPPDPGQSLPEVDTIRISSTVSRPLRGIIQVDEPIAATSTAPPGVLLSAGSAQVPSTTRLAGRVSNEAGHPISGAIVHLIDPSSPERPAFTSGATKADGAYEILNVNFAREYLYEAVYAGITFSAPGDLRKPHEAASPAKPFVGLMLVVEGLAPEKAFADGAKLDVSKPFYPLGQQPQPGSAFYFSLEEAFTRPGAKVRIYDARTLSPQDEGAISTGSIPLSHNVSWEYWNSRKWAPLPVTSFAGGATPDLDRTDLIEFTVPIDLAASVVSGQEARWVRMRLQSGSYGFKNEVAFDTGGGTSKFTYVIAQPPVLASFRIGYAWQYGPFHPDQVLSYNNFRYSDRTQEAIWPGVTFLPFDRMEDVTPALYLGFDKKPPTEELGLFFDVVEKPGETAGPALTWEYWTGFEWRRMPASDETGHLRRPGIVNLLAQPDDTLYARFGKPLHWIRGRLKEDGPPGEPALDGIFPNAVWASERRTINDLPLGTSNGTPNQAFSITQVPILPGERIEIRELSGARANVEWRILAMELSGGDTTALREIEQLIAKEGANTAISRGRLRLTRNRQKQITEAWVFWESRDQLFFSGPEDRHYALDRAGGRLYLGDGVNGRVPPAGASLLMRQMATGGGSKGNVAARAISQVLGVVPGIEAVFNPKPAEGGADGESTAAALDRGPRTVRHRGRAMQTADYETLAYEASPAVAMVRAIPARNPAGLRLPGWITLVIVPRSEDPRPYPSFGLREHVRKFLERRTPAEVAALHRIHITGPVYLPVDVAATLAPVDRSQAGAVEKGARNALQRLLHPLTGGPAGQGWDLGRDVFLSDVAAELERVEGVDYVEELTLLLQGVPQGESLPVGEDQIVAAGSITLKLRESER